MLARLLQLSLLLVLLLAHSARADEMRPFFLKPDPARDEKLLGAMKVLSSELFRNGATPKLDLDSLIGFRQSVFYGLQYKDPARDGFTRCGLGHGYGCAARLYGHATQFFGNGNSTCIL